MYFITMGCRVRITYACLSDYKGQVDRLGDWVVFQSTSRAFDVAHNLNLPFSAHSELFTG